MCVRQGTNSSKDQITQDFFSHFYFSNQTKHLHIVPEWGTHYTCSHAQAAGKREQNSLSLPSF